MKQKPDQRQRLTVDSDSFVRPNCKKELPRSLITATGLITAEKATTHVKVSQKFIEAISL